ncbi:zinc finger BED domain-containing protein 1-like [Myzus persicae]|uniref:zinc finger BED domain-containing protein 1-like n=1 Tax=Myzus persicae TaxID=13164 RepID=UPI000B936928|nr:zinc finger BED domain-containing protein 1-like [Myzus persicae]
MLDRFVELEDSIRGTLGLLDNPPQGLTSEQWVISKQLIQVLRPFEEATTAVSGSKYMTASIIQIIAQGLKNVCELMTQKLFSLPVQNVLQKLISGMSHRDRWGTIELSKTLIQCTFLDPRFKDVSLSTSLKQSTKNDIVELTASIISASRVPNNAVREEIESIPQEHESDSNRISIWDSTDSKVAQVQPMGTVTSRALVEVQRYLEEAIQNRNSDPLKWWFENKHNHPYLSQLARNMLCALGTSVPCERVFSKAGQVLSDRRSSLSSKKVQMLLFLNYNE